MSLKAGSTVGNFEILSLLGAGGMGEVWQARDLRLGREVAIKVLPDTFTRDADRLLRFEREARILASLNHSRIAGLFGLEEFEGQKLLIMELARGETLAQRLGRGPIPLDEACDIAIQVAEALEAAHESGIVHRDLKPANVKLSDDGTVKVLDFGIAKVFESDEAPSVDDTSSPTMVKTASGMGIIMGTAAYMSPEQARGKKVDRRADVWAWGVLLWEMLSGRRLFLGETVTDTLAAVLRQDPDPTQLPPETPPAVRRLVSRCLVRDPKRRLRDMGDARLELEEIRSTPAPVEERSRVEAGPRGRREALAWLVAAAAVVVAALLLVLRSPESETARPVKMFDIVSGVDADWIDIPMLAPDGERVAFKEDDKLWVRGFDRVAPREVPESDGATTPFWSPDSRSLAFVRDTKLWRWNVGEDKPKAISTLPPDQSWIGGAWSEAGRIALAQWRGGIFDVSADGGELRSKVPAREGEVDFHGVAFLPDGSLVTILHAASDDADKLLLVDGDRRIELMHLGSDGGASPMYSPSGHIVFSRFSAADDGLTTWALPFDAKGQKVLGEAVLLFEDGAHPSVSNVDSLVYVSNVRARPSQLVWIDPDGHVGEPIGDARRNIVDPALAPDGSRVAVSILEGENQDIWIVDSKTGLRQRATFSGAEDRHPAWSPDGSTIAFARRQRYDWLSPDNGIWLRSADGSSPEERLSQGTQPAFTNDGEKIVMNSLSVRAENDIFVVDAVGGSEAAPFLESDARTRSAVPSPDGRFIAFESTESGGVDVFVVSFPASGGKWQISSDGGSRPRWSRTGDSIYFVRHNELWRVPVVSGRALSVGSPRRVVAGTDADIVFERGYDVSADGRIVAVRELDRERPTLRLVENWSALLGGM